MWSDRKLELYVEGKLKDENSNIANPLWAAYVRTREDLVTNIFPYIGSQEPNLTDHGAAHICNVIDNAGRVLGCGERGGQRRPQVLDRYSACELLLLLLGCLLHDIGNIIGREKHNLVGADVWRDTGTSFPMWTADDRRAIFSICRAHTGKTNAGSDDTLEPLSIGPTYFQNENVRAAEIAAILRFSDELAEGPQRTSEFLLTTGRYNEQSSVYHLYALCTRVTIDRQTGRIALSYNVNIAHNYFTSDKVRAKQRLKDFLDLIYRRVLKLEHERVFARHYAPEALPFKETSVSIYFNKNEAEVPHVLNPLILNDFNVRGLDSGLIDRLDKSYRSSELAASIIEKGQ